MTHPTLRALINAPLRLINFSKFSTQDILIPLPSLRQLNFQFFSIQDILKCEHSRRTETFYKKPLQCNSIWSHQFRTWANVELSFWIHGEISTVNSEHFIADIITMSTTRKFARGDKINYSNEEKLALGELVGSLGKSLPSDY